MRRIVAAIFGVVALCSAVLAQVDEIRRLEQQYIEARRSGGSSLSSLIAADYFEVIPPGTTRTTKHMTRAEPAPNSDNNPHIRVRIFGNAALVTGTVDGPQGRGRDRFLRVWARENGRWKVAAFHATWIGDDRAKGAAPPLTEPSGATFGYTPKNAAEHAIWKQHEAVGQAWAKGDQETYRALLAPDFVRVAVDGSQFSHDEWVARLQGPSPAVRQANVRMRVYGTLAVLTYLNIDARPEGATVPPSLQWVTRIFTKQGDGSWKLLLTQPTIARQGSSS